MGMVAIFIKWPQTNFHPAYPWRLHTKFGFDWQSGFREDVWTLWKTLDGRQRMDAWAWVNYKLTSIQVS